MDSEDRDIVLAIIFGFMVAIGVAQFYVQVIVLSSLIGLVTTLGYLAASAGGFMYEIRRLRAWDAD